MPKVAACSRGLWRGCPITWKDHWPDGRRVGPTLDLVAKTIVWTPPSLKPFSHHNISIMG